MSCNSCTSCNNNCETELEVPYVISYSDNILLSTEIENEDKIVTVSFIGDSAYLKIDELLINDVCKLECTSNFISVFTNGSEEAVLAINSKDKILNIFDSEDDEIFVCNLSNKIIGEEEQYPLFNLKLEEVISEDNDKQFICSIDMVALPGNAPIKVYDLKGDVSEQLLYKAKYIIYELELLRDLIKDIEKDIVNYLIFKGSLYEVVRNDYSGLRLRDINTDELRSIPYMNISRMSNIHFLDNKSLYYNGKELLKDVNGELIIVEKDLEELTSNITKFLTLCSTTIEELSEDINNNVDVVDIQTQFAHVESGLRDIGINKEDITALVLFGDSNNSWHSITISQLEDILLSTTKVIEEKK